MTERIRPIEATVRRGRRILAPLLLAVAAAACDGTRLANASAAALHVRWQPRLVLVALDLSGSMAPAALTAPITRLAGELRGGDRLVVLPLTGRAGDPPLLDTTLAGAGADRLSDLLGLSTRVSRQIATERRETLARHLVALADTVRSTQGASRSTAIVDAVCTAAEYVHSQPTMRATALVLTDGVEESRWIAVAGAVPSNRTARELALRVRATRDCPIDTPGFRLRLVGIRHATDTPGLVRWWRAVLTHLGYVPRADDVSPHPLGPLLVTAAPTPIGDDPQTVRDPRRTPPFHPNTLERT